MLLKTAAQTVPNFWMSLLLIPAEICNRIQRHMNEFWWGGGGSSKGIKWYAWDRLCNAKEDGGLGFKHLHQFNIEMLVKQGWRLLNNVNPLVTDLMKAKYYPHTNFLNAKLGTNPSYMWRSIMEAQEVIRQGSRKRIGDGRSTNIWEEPWLPCRVNGYLTTRVCPELQEVFVSNLMEEGGSTWDEAVLLDVLNERDVHLIRKIPIPGRQGPDSWFWFVDDSGMFSVKSCYRQIMGEQTWTSAEFWRKLWSLDLPGKIISFMWRVCRMCLPTAVNLVKKRVEISNVCTWCLCQQEDEMHVLFACSFARTVWTNLGLQDLIPGDQRDQMGTILQKMQHVFHVYTREKLAWVAIVCWNLWNPRNKWLWDKVNVSAFGVQSTAVSMRTEWDKAQHEKKVVKPAVSATARRWIRPP